MALIKCPECGKEISDQAASCPNCGCPVKKTNSDFGEDNSGKKVEISIKKLDIKLNKKTKGILGGVIVCLVILIGVIIYAKTNVTITEEENALLLSIDEIRDGLLAPDSLIIYDGATYYFDPEYEQLKIFKEIPSDFNEKLIITMVNFSSEASGGSRVQRFGIMAYNLNNEVIASVKIEDENDIDEYVNEDIFYNDENFLVCEAALILGEEDKTIKKYSDDDVASLIAKTDKKKIKVKSTFKERSEKEKEELLNQKFDEAVQNDNVSYMNTCINKYAVSDAQKEEFQNKLDKYHYDLGCDLLASGDYEKARNNFKIDNNYDDTETQIKKSYYEEAQANSNNYDIDKIIELYQKADDYSNAKDLVETAETYKVYSANVEKLQNEDVTLDDLKNLLPFFEKYKDFANCQKICEYIYEMEKSPYLGKWELVKQSGKELHDVEKYINITPYWDGDNDHFRLTFSDSLDDFDPTSRSCQSNGIKTIGTSDDSADVVVNDDGTLTIETSVRGFAFGKGMSTSYYDYTYQKVD